MKDIMKRYVKSFLMITFLILGCSLWNTLHPYIVKKVLDLDFTSERIIKQIAILILMYMAVHGLRVLFMNMRNIKINKTVANVLQDVREKLFIKVLSFPMKIFDKYSSSDIYTRLTADVNNMNSLFSDSIPVLINSSLYIIFMIIMMLIADLKLGMVGLITLVVIGINSFYFICKIKKLNKLILDKRDDENQKYSELYRKHKLTYLFGLQKSNVEEMEDLLEEELKYRKKFIFIESFGLPLSRLIEAIGIFVVLYISLTITQEIPLGNIYLIIYYIKQCRSPLNEIFNQIQDMQTCLNSYERIKKLLKIKETEDIKQGTDVKLLQGNIEFSQVCMSYGDKEVLKNISFMIKLGQKVTIVGRTGVGKTTLTGLLMRLYELTSGNILIDGYDIKELTIECIRRNISYISQTPYIFKDTIRNNITLGSKEIKDKDILELATNIGADTILDNLKDGLDTEIIGSRLSSGELQIIAFLRAILHKTNIYIFDEPTANLDFKTEKMIQNIIDTIAKTSTVIVIAHRKSTIEKSDKVIYLKDGKVDKIDNKVS